MTETVNSAVKRSLGFAVRARSWFREFREIALMCVVYNIKASSNSESLRITAIQHIHLMMNSIGCTLLSIQKQMICSIHSLN